MRRRLGSLTTLFLTLLLVVPASAWADSWTGPDPAGDATVYSFDPQPEPCGTVTRTPSTEGDVRRLRVRHTPDLVVVSVDVTGLVNRYRTSTMFDVVTPDREWTVDVSHYQGRTEVDYFRTPRIRQDQVGECGSYAYAVRPRTCRGAVGTIDVRGGRITVSVPRRCLGTPRWVRAGASVYCGRGHGSSDGWRPAGADDGDVTTAVVGRRVYAGARR
ncbi:hypothetical protein [Nocardioides rubriscoriae]|uniref:hypothetical protein n=1 Tax=Nocardioides rubriscoriae TaxID=642762 RepID=UPI0011DFEC67|nr:hypothetical protein [Nocardioides rubriscoriae]